MYGIEPKDLDKIKKVFASNKQINKVILFGSRAKGTYKDGSDIDIAISGKATFNDILDITYQLELLGLLYDFDVQHLEAIKDIDILSHIDRIGKILYEK